MRLQPLLAFDFDGTLAPIVTRPNDARISVAVSRGLAQLSEFLPVAIVTGRAVADVAPRLGFEPRYIIGNHGGEDPSGALRRGSVAALDALREKLIARIETLRAAGVEMEDKQYSLALHFRLARNRALASACIERELGDLDPLLKRFGGKLVVNVSPADAPDKGEAVTSLLKQCGSKAAVFVGDDVTDEAVFARAGHDWLTVRIGRDERASLARYFLDSPFGSSDASAEDALAVEVALTSTSVD